MKKKTICESIIVVRRIVIFIPLLIYNSEFEVFIDSLTLVACLKGYENVYEVNYDVSSMVLRILFLNRWILSIFDLLIVDTAACRL